MPTKKTLKSGTEMVRGSKKTNGNILDGERHEADPFPKRLTAAEKRNTPALTSAERKQWRTALKVIDKGWKTFVEVGLALRTIRESRLYREDYDSWEAFCRDVVGMSKTEANRQIIDAEVAAELVAPIGVNGKEEAALPPPENRAQVRALARVKDPVERCKIWQQVVAKSDETPITARAIEAIIEPAEEPIVSNPPPPLPSVDTVDDTTLDDSVIAGFDVIDTLRIARREADWSLVDAVIEHLEAQQQ